MGAASPIDLNNDVLNRISLPAPKPETPRHDTALIAPLQRITVPEFDLK